MLCGWVSCEPLLKAQVVHQMFLSFSLEGWGDDGCLGPAQQQPQFHSLLPDVIPVQKYSFIHHTGQG